MERNQQTGSQVGQSGSGSQEGQNTGQQSQQGNGSGSQEGQSNQQGSNDIRFDGQGEQETLTDFVSRVLADRETARKQAASYRQRLGEGTSQQGQGTQQEQGQQGQSQDTLAATVRQLQTDLQAERTQRRSEKIQSQLVTALSGANAVNPARAVRLIDLADLDIDDAGNVQDTEAAIRSLKADMPQIFQASRGSGDGGAGRDGDSDSQNMNVLIRRRAGVRAS